MEIISNIALISINETMIVQLLSFLVFLMILNRVMIHPLRESMTQRNDHIKNLEKGVGLAEEEMAALTSRIEEQEATAAKEAQTRRIALEATGQEAADSIIKEARKKIEQLKKQTNREVEELLVQARAQVQKESDLISISIMENVLSRKLTI